jgi:hypothetical protein
MAGRKESCCVTRNYLGTFVKETAWSDRIREISHSSNSPSMNVGPCHHGMARPQVADEGTASYMEGSCE